MADDLKGTWKETGVGLGHAFRDLGKTLIKTGANAMKKADNWANNEEEGAKAQAETQEGATAEETKTEE